jgi:small-conductance mechanosensitive channel
VIFPDKIKLNAKYKILKQFREQMDTWLDYLETQFKLDAEIVTKLLLSLLIFIVLGLLRFGILRLAFRRSVDIKSRYNWRKSTGYILYFLLAILIVPIWVRNGVSLTTYLGLLSAGIAIALKDPLANLAGWVFIIWRHPFRVGDRIQVGDQAGDVIDLRIFQFSLMEIGNWVEADQSTGRIIHVPNGMVFTHPLANYSHGFDYIWNEIPITITFESDWEKAKKILLEIGEKYSAKAEQNALQKKKISDEYQLFYKHLTPTVYLQGSVRGVEMTLRYLCEPRKRRGSEHGIWEAVLLAFNEHSDISFAYPTYRYVGKGELPWQDTAS